MAKKGRNAPKREKWWILVVIVIFLITFVLIVYRTDTLITKDYSKLPRSGPFEEWKTCGGDIDCVETQKSCCGCEMGGDQVAISRQYLEKWKVLLEKDCRAVAGCRAVYNCEEGKAVCELGKCVFKK
jgi:hypothetical protein